MSELLQIVVAGHCLGCDEAHLLYDKVRDSFPRLAVQLLNLDETGTTWNILGRAVDGPLVGDNLAPVIHANHFWFAWAVFKPNTSVVSG